MVFAEFHLCRNCLVVSRKKKKSNKLRHVSKLLYLIVPCSYGLCRIPSLPELSC